MQSIGIEMSEHGVPYIIRLQDEIDRLKQDLEASTAEMQLFSETEQGNKALSEEKDKLTDQLSTAIEMMGKYEDASKVLESQVETSKER